MSLVSSPACPALASRTGTTEGAQRRSVGRRCRRRPRSVPVLFQLQRFRFQQELTTMSEKLQDVRARERGGNTADSTAADSPGTCDDEAKQIQLQGMTFAKDLRLTIGAYCELLLLYMRSRSPSHTDLSARHQGEQCARHALRPHGDYLPTCQHCRHSFHLETSGEQWPSENQARV
ncbi:hypothetical protein HIM_06771 [Hirsutella minnesotensis 3608]|uniref:Uncharacterized protein n=1 Tax=Hirsutella minnesotensis 3608 TaxID=1043627 RepID=A0A0F7ZTX6_9HYPO|nr:hypothetical protein HIM_06771 [Hirsutella minnesotensis 3608]